VQYHSACGTAPLTSERWADDTFVKRLFLVLLLSGCAHGQPRVEESLCPSQLPASALNDPVALRTIIVDARTRRFAPSCWACEEGSACASCERLFGLAARQLSELRTKQAAQEAVALVLDTRLNWDAGPALILAREITRMGPIVLPYLRPHASESFLAKQIVECIETKDPCF
jgi:hypothetical protein